MNGRPWRTAAMDVAHSARGFKRGPRPEALGDCRFSGLPLGLPLGGGRVGCRAVPLFRSRNRFSVPTVKLGPVIVVVVCLLVAGLVALAVIEPRPPLRHFEVPVPNERFAR